MSDFDDIDPSECQRLDMNGFGEVVDAFRDLRTHGDIESLEHFNEAIAELTDAQRTQVHDYKSAEVFEMRYGAHFEPNAIGMNSNVRAIDRDLVLQQAGIDPTSIQNDTLREIANQTIEVSVRSLPGFQFTNSQTSEVTPFIEPQKVEQVELVEAALLATINQRAPEELMSHPNRTQEMIHQTIAMQAKEATADGIKAYITEAIPRLENVTEEAKPALAKAFFDKAFPELKDKDLSIQEATKIMSDLGIKEAPLFNAANGILQRAISEDKAVFSATHATELKEDVKEFIKNHLEENKALLAVKMMAEVTKEFINRVQSEDKTLFSQTHQERFNDALQDFIKGAAPIVGRLTEGFISLFNK